MNSIQWHQDSLKNQLAYLKQFEAELQRKQEEVARTSTNDKPKTRRKAPR